MLAEMAARINRVGQLASLQKIYPAVPRQAPFKRRQAPQTLRQKRDRQRKQWQVLTVSQMSVTKSRRKRTSRRILHGTYEDEQRITRSQRPRQK